MRKGWIIILGVIVLIFGAYYIHQSLTQLGPETFEAFEQTDMLILESRCEELQTTEQKDLCYNNLANKDASYCEKIVDEDIKNNCLAQKNIPYNITICENMQDLEDKEHCISFVAGNTNNPELCKSLSDRIADMCYQRIMFEHEQQDLTFCQNFKLQQSKDRCYLIFASKKGDISLCENVEEYSETFYGSREDCYAAVAFAKSDIRLCEKITLSNYKEQECYLPIAVDTEEIGLCGKITDKSLKKQCKEEIKGSLAFLYFYI